MPTILDIILYEESFREIRKKELKEPSLNIDPTMAIDYPRIGFINRFKMPVSQLLIKSNKLLLIPVVGSFCYSFIKN